MRFLTGKTESFSYQLLSKEFQIPANSLFLFMGAKIPTLMALLNSQNFTHLQILYSIFISAKISIFKAMSNQKSLEELFKMLGIGSSNSRREFEKARWDFWPERRKTFLTERSYGFRYARNEARAGWSETGFAHHYTPVNWTRASACPANYGSYRH